MLGEMISKQQREGRKRPVEEEADLEDVSDMGWGFGRNRLGRV